MHGTNKMKRSGIRFTEPGASAGPGKKQIPDKTKAAMERMELYCMAHPGSPSAVRRPRLILRGQVWIAMLGPSIEEGIVGFGNIIEAALRAFDAQYLRGLRPPEIRVAPTPLEFGSKRER
ncbi:MAG TPA: hypothetical protein VGI85_10135 [Chthoniobacterales bacterium]|jgi:hypothetical protein